MPRTGGTLGVLLMVTGKRLGVSRSMMRVSSNVVLRGAVEVWKAFSRQSSPVFVEPRYFPQSANKNFTGPIRINTLMVSVAWATVHRSGLKFCAVVISKIHMVSRIAGGLEVYGCWWKSGRKYNAWGVDEIEQQPFVWSKAR